MQQQQIFHSRVCVDTVDGVTFCLHHWCVTLMLCRLQVTAIETAVSETDVFAFSTCIYDIITLDHTIVGRAIRPLDVDRQHQSTSYAYCYEFGLPSDCSPGTPAGQCSLTSYAFCCGVGTPVTYSETPVNTLIRMCWSRQSCLQCHC